MNSPFSSELMMMMTTTYDQIDIDEMLQISHLCPPSIYTTHHFASPAPHDHKGHEEKPRPRRRIKKMKEGGENMSSGIRIKRKLNEEQVKCLEESFEINEHKLESGKKDRLASELGLDPRQVAIWFQNRRARWKCKNVEEEYFKLKAQHDSNLIHNCQLQTKVLQLKEQLCQSQKEIQRLLERQLDIGNSPAASTISSIEMQPPFLGDFPIDNGSAILMTQPPFLGDIPMDNGSVISTPQPPFFADFSMDSGSSILTSQPLFFGDFTIDGLENIFNYLPQNNYVQGGFEWVNTMM